MSVELMRDIDARYRAASGLSERRFYSIFYSRIDPSPIMVLGINPGGDPATWTPDKLASQSFYENWEHEYVDCSYAIQEPMLPFLMAVTGGDRESVRSVPKSNLVFRRSPRMDDLKAIHGMSVANAQRECRPFVEEIIKSANPSLIVLEGMTLFEPFRRFYCDRLKGEPCAPDITCQHRGVQVRCFAASTIKVTCLDRVIFVVAIGHPSSFGSKHEFGQVIEATRLIFVQTTQPG